MRTFNSRYLNSGYSWSLVSGAQVNLTYSYLSAPQAPSYYLDGSGNSIEGYAPFLALPPGEASPSQIAAINAQNAIRESVADYARNSWSSVANIVWANATAGTTGRITFGYATKFNSRNTPAAGYPDGSIAPSGGGDVWLNSESEVDLNLGIGGNGFSNLLHELGHALGLEHAGTPGGGEITNLLAASPLPFTERNLLWSVMALSRVPIDERGNFPIGAIKTTSGYAITPMLYDIAAIQLLYGANMDYKKEDNTQWIFTDNSHPYSLNTPNTFDTPGSIKMTIWDAGGAGDRIDASGMTTDVRINLNQGEWSAIGTENKETANVVIAFGAIIEDATGGTGADTLIGNAVANKLEGNAGKDTLDGGTAANAGQTINGTAISAGQGDGQVDILNGGAGEDTYILREGGGRDKIVDIKGTTNRVKLLDKHGREVRRDQFLFQDSFDPGTWSNIRGDETITIRSPLKADVKTGDGGVIQFQIGDDAGDFQDGDFGIRRAAAFVEPVSPEPVAVTHLCDDWVRATQADPLLAPAAEPRSRRASDAACASSSRRGWRKVKNSTCCCHESRSGRRSTVAYRLETAPTNGFIGVEV